MRLFVYTSQSLDKMGCTRTSVSKLTCRSFAPSFVQSYRRFERRCYVHIFSKPSDNAGIGFPRQYEHSYFFSES